MLISQLLERAGISFKASDIQIDYITDDSRKVREGTLFVCHEKGEDFVSQALERGAAMVVAKRKLSDNTIVVDDTRKAYSLLCAAFFSFSHRQLRLIGVTGTNGKTTTAAMLYSILSLAGNKCAMLGTVGNLICSGDSPSELTTPDSFEMHRMFRDMVNCGTQFCIIEASSQGLHQQRLYGLEFETGIFLNLTRDHLDYHGTLQEYKQSKRLLTENSRLSVINYDDESRDEFIDCAKGRVRTFSVEDDRADFTARAISFSQGSTDFVVVSDSLVHRMKLQVPGVYNVSNAMAAIITAIECGVSLEDCAAALRSFYGVKGRFELVPTEKDYRIVIDYAHTPDSLKKVLLALDSFEHKRIITLFGCGGDRDKEKRGEMGRIAAAYSDIVILTDDNPRSEDPGDIIDDILDGTQGIKTPVYIKQGRARAIHFALSLARRDDIVLLAGKGHELYQIIGEEKIPFDERKIIREILDNK